MSGLQWGVVLAVSLVAAAYDLGARRIPNFLTGPAFLLGLACNFLYGGWPGVQDGLLGSLILGVPFLLLFIFAGGGAGDAKLMAAIGMWLGVRSGIPTLICVVGSGLVLGIAFAVWKGRFAALLGNIGHMLRMFFYSFVGKMTRTETGLALPAIHEQQTMPYGVAIFLGACISLGGFLSWGW